MKDAAEPAATHQLMRESDRGTPPIVEPYEGLLPLAGSRRIAHGASISQRACQRFFARDIPAGFERRHGMLGVQMIGRQQVDDIDRLVLQHAGGVGAILLPDPARRERARARRIVAARGLHRDRAL
jgi:hypothetical protein